jgi:murein DD-endopeptidase MepM/ murein hydrolase activator NlpD
MDRRLFVFQLALAGCGGALSPPPQRVEVAAELNPAVLNVARVSDAFSLPIVPHDTIEQLVRWQKGVRDLFRDAADALTTKLGLVVPDLSVLTTDPIASMRTDESSGFGWRDDPVYHRRRQFHSGADFRSQPGVPVLAAGDGIVVFTGWYYGYGQMIDIDHGGGVVTRYAHLSHIDIKKDGSITAGQQIGRVGMTGRTTGPHLHFEVRLDGRPVSPVTAMTVAALQRESPDAGRIAAFALSPELQAVSLDAQDETNQHKKTTETRPERPNRTKRSQVLW